ncbi:hypothetical protein M0811_04637 [Anaeramoeba ignava]|uniref:Uncharacterized protein n=1 Tax=Anaeramoeba ignava TaxID=1746090 RepID=A0A9Q0RHM8_ANAIG|nr:hypothetical protein M0811_04637 [Anaeramoeba ignava]
MKIFFNQLIEKKQKEKEEILKKNQQMKKEIDKSKLKSTDIISFTFINDLKQFSLISIYEIIQEINTIIKSEIFEWILEIKELEKKRKLFKLFGKEGEIFIKQNIQDYWKQYSQQTEMEDSKEIIKKFIQLKKQQIENIFKQITKEISEFKSKGNQIKKRILDNLEKIEINFENSFQSLPEKFYSSQKDDNSNQETHLKLEMSIHEQEHELLMTGNRFPANKENKINISFIIQENINSKIKTNSYFKLIQKIPEMIYPKMNPQFQNENFLNNLYVTQNFINPINQKEILNFRLRFFTRILLIIEPKSKSKIWIFLTQQEIEDIMEFILDLEMRNIKKDNNNNNNSNNNNNEDYNDYKDNDKRNSFILMSLDGAILGKFGSVFQQITTNKIKNQKSLREDPDFPLINEIRKTLFVLGLLKFHWGIFEIGGDKNEKLSNHLRRELENFNQLQDNFHQSFSQNLSTFKKKIQFNLEQISKNNSKKD